MAGWGLCPRREDEVYYSFEVQEGQGAGKVFLRSMDLWDHPSAELKRVFMVWELCFSGAEGMLGVRREEGIPESSMTTLIIRSLVRRF